ncbi:NAD(P)-binding protein [Daldinia caldariorum]|uniref:NAD(P)-binding protein n=1 Tax=Daldinia caldariorum TaxID=326644 RepID=UPI0020087D82|nr:NAD(P)-binding protein [Daldinia caldariorum]KAI1464597.1 NAD(P)-binding protein [Daldinia caldariorum]
MTGIQSFTVLSFGFVGLGNMGSVMSLNLAGYAQKQGFPKVKLWNRSRGKANELAKQGFIEVADTLESIATDCTIIHTCLANDEVALSVYRRILTAAKPGLILVDHSTLYPTTSSTLHAEAEATGSSFLSYPILAVLKEYIVPTIGRAIIDCGEDTRKEALLKILGNSCILGTIELMSENFTLAEKAGFDARLFYEFIPWVNYGKKIRDGAFSGATGFTLPGGMKDATYIRRLGAENSTPTPVIDHAWNHLTTAKALGGEGLDWSSCAAGMRVTAGCHRLRAKTSV